MRRGAMGGWLIGAVLTALTLVAPAAALAGPFTNWAAIVVAGDWHAHDGSASEAFDNARRDVTAGLVARGFTAGNIQQFSVRPQNYPGVNLLPSDIESIAGGLAEVAGRATGGCLLYFSTHGAPQGMLIGTQGLTPYMLRQMIAQSCAGRPTIVVTSACFSGVFVPALSGPNRMILTAARPDRASFGCGTDDKYPYFDTCFLKVLPGAHDFAALAPAVQDCVAQREIQEGMGPPSEPQFWVDPMLRPMLPLMAFSTAPPPPPVVTPAAASATTPRALTKGGSAARR